MNLVNNSIISILEVIAVSTYCFLIIILIQQLISFYCIFESSYLLNVQIYLLFCFNHIIIYRIYNKINHISIFSGDYNLIRSPIV